MVDGVEVQIHRTTSTFLSCLASIYHEVLVWLNMLLHQSTHLAERNAHVQMMVDIRTYHGRLGGVVNCRSRTGSLRAWKKVVYLHGTD